MTIESPFPKEIDLNTILFVKWLVVNNRLGRLPEGRPTGEVYTKIVAARGGSVIDKLSPRSLRQTIIETGDY